MARAADLGVHAGVSYLYQQMNYKEPGVMSEKGKLKGYAVDVLWRFAEQFSVSAQGRFLGGHLEYNGATFSGTPLKQTTNDTVREYRALLTYHMDSFAFYTGYGQRYWKNDLVISYLRETTYKYVPIGFRYIVRPFFFSYELRHFLEGLNKSHMSDVTAQRSDVEMKQKSGKGYALEGGLLHQAFNLDWKLSLMYEYWQIQDSETSFDGVDNLIEPANNTSSLTLTLGVFY